MYEDVVVKFQILKNCTLIFKSNNLFFKDAKNLIFLTFQYLHPIQLYTNPRSIIKWIDDSRSAFKIINVASYPTFATKQKKVSIH